MRSQLNIETERYEERLERLRREVSDLRKELKEKDDLLSAYRVENDKRHQELLKQQRKEQL